MNVAVVVPVKNGARWLSEVLEAVLREGPDDVLVIDSGSSDGSFAIASAAGAPVRVLEIAASDFGHGRTRNLGMRSTTADVVVFLTQDATPVPGWLDAYRDAFAADPVVRAAYGPHLPRPDTSPMIARELTEFFARHPLDEPWLSNVNAAYRREGFPGFPDVAYAEDQAIARALGAEAIRYVPEAGVLHAHDYGPLTFMRRYFDEYRGLRETTGHVEPLRLRGVLDEVRADRRAAGGSPYWAARSAVHHGGRRVFSALGSRSAKLPARVERTISLEGTTARAAAPAAPTPGSGGPKQPVRVPASGEFPWGSILEVARDGPTPLLDPVPGMADAESLHIAVVIPYFRRGSGGHSTIYNLLTRLEERGHTVTTWLYDPLGMLRDDWPAVVRGNLREFFRPPKGPVFKGFDRWFGADVVLATGWETVDPVLTLDHCRARAYLVQDHEPEFFATSAQSIWAAATYDAGLHPICASPWLAELVGHGASVFDLGVDEAIYHPRDGVERRGDTVVFYARDVTPRRGVPLGLLALQELHRRRPQTRFVLFGDIKPVKAPFPYEHLGIATPDELAFAYSEATVGLSLSLTNYSLIPQEMLACGLPCVEVAGRSLETVYGTDGPLELAPPDPIALADAMERLLDDPGLAAQRAQDGLRFVAERTWERASEQLEDGLRTALRRRVAAAPDVAPRRASSPEELRRLGRDSRGTADPNARTVPIEPPYAHEGTERLFARLDERDVEAVRAALTDKERNDFDTYEGAQRKTLALVWGVWHRVPAVLEKTGLTPDQPPDDVHAMARGSLAAGGALYYADMLSANIRRSGRTMDDVRRGLDFGCSSGRAVRALHACWPQVEWHGCDPNGDAIAWAQEHLPGIAFLNSPTDPPLPYPDAHFDFAFAISIWSHYGERAAIRWLEEMARIVAPDGTLIITTHGLQSIQHYRGERPPEQLEQIRRAMYRHGYWFKPEFGEEGDWGVKHSEWGTAFFTPEWMLRWARRDWLVADFQVGQNAGNQDVYVLVRRGGGDTAAVHAREVDAPEVSEDDVRLLFRRIVGRAPTDAEMTGAMAAPIGHTALTLLHSPESEVQDPSGDVVQALFASLLGRAALPDELRGLSAAGLSVGRIVRELLDSDERLARDGDSPT